MTTSTEDPYPWSWIYRLDDYQVCEELTQSANRGVVTRLITDAGIRRVLEILVKAFPQHADLKPRCGCGEVEPCECGDEGREPTPERPRREAMQLVEEKLAAAVNVLNGEADLYDRSGSREAAQLMQRIRETWLDELLPEHMDWPPELHIDGAEIPVGTRLQVSGVVTCHEKYIVTRAGDRQTWLDREPPDGQGGPE
jgi:hypothetical protein